MSQHEIEQIELSIEEAKKIVKKGELAEKLAANPDFKKIVMEGYFVEEASRLALLFSDPVLPEEHREMVHRDLLGVGAFKRYLSALVQLGKNAAKSIEEAEEELEHVRAEELETEGNA